MTQLRQEFISALRIRNYSPKAIEQYTLCVRHFAQYFNKSPELFGPKEIKHYLLYPAEIQPNGSALRKEKLLPLVA